MTHYMLDLETLGTQPGCVILSLGCVEFDPMTGEIIRTLYGEINQKSCFEAGLTVDDETLDWWHGQGDTAKALLQRTETGGYDIRHVINSLDILINIEYFATGLPVFVWANSPSFDCAILRHAHELQGAKTPWKYYHEQDCRTLVQLGRTLGIDPKKDLPFEGTAHNALHDAIHQAKYISAIYQHIHALQGVAQCDKGDSAC